MRRPSVKQLWLGSRDRPQQDDRRANEFYWPIEWLKRIARYPHDNETWLGGPHTIIANDEPPEPFAPNTKMSCLMLLANPSEFGRWTRPAVVRSGDRPEHVARSGDRPQQAEEEVVFYDSSASTPKNATSNSARDCRNSSADFKTASSAKSSTRNGPTWRCSAHGSRAVIGWDARVPRPSRVW